MAEEKIEIIKKLIEENAPTSYYIIIGIGVIVLFLIMGSGGKGENSEGYSSKLKQLILLGKK